MDAALNERWMNSSPPFNGCTLLCEKCHVVIGRTIVRYSLERIDSLLKIEHVFYVNADWHEHDGFINNSQIVARDELISELSSQPYKWFRVLDYLVTWGIYDPGFQFYLRFGLDEDEPDTMVFDLTSDEATVERLAADLETSFNGEFQIVDAKSHFDRIYGG